MEPARSARGRVRAALLAVVLLAGFMGGIVARAAPAAAARVSVPAVHTSVTIVDHTRSTPPRGANGVLPYRSLPTSVYLPGTPGPWPFVVFATGYNISSDALNPMLWAWAEAGYVVAAPAFPISTSEAPGAARRDDLWEEPGDLSAVISYFQAATSDPSSPFYGMVDPNRIGAAGHSDGGIDAAAIALNTAAIDRRVRGTMILAGEFPSIPGGVNGPYNPAPVLVMGGTQDTFVTPGSSDALYNTAAGPKAQVTLLGAGHLPPFVWDEYYEYTVWEAQIGFLDYTLRGDPSGLARLMSAGNTPGVTTMRQVGLMPNPIGSLDTVTADPFGNVVVDAWALDPDTTDPIDIHVYVDGQLAGAFSAAGTRDDVVSAYPSMGAAHGLHVQYPGWSVGAHQVCAYAINVGWGDRNPLLGCRSVVVTRAPFGTVDRATVDPLGRATVSGWAADPDTSASITVHVYVDGTGVAAVLAGGIREDVAGFGLGVAHGYSVALPWLGHGQHTVCVYGINAGPGLGNATLGCRQIVVNRNPFGNLETLPVGIGGTLTANGWALDPDSDATLIVHVYVDGVFRAQGTTGVTRNDVAAAFGVGPAHGFAIAVPALGEGAHQVCAYGINLASGSANSLLGSCRSVVVAHGPFGVLDSVTPHADRTLSLTGWAIDPDTTAPITQHLYVDGAFAGQSLASAPRGDLASAFPLYGAPHGLVAAIGPFAPGVHTVCAYGINVGPGANALTGCRTVSVP